MRLNQEKVHSRADGFANNCSCYFMKTCSFLPHCFYPSCMKIVRLRNVISKLKIVKCVWEENVFHATTT